MSPCPSTVSRPCCVRSSWGRCSWDRSRPGCSRCTYAPTVRAAGISTSRNRCPVLVQGWSLPLCVVAEPFSLLNFVYPVYCVCLNRPLQFSALGEPCLGICASTWLGCFSTMTNVIENQSRARTAVPPDEREPPVPWQNVSLQSCIWRSPHSPRSWRTASMTRKMPYAPG